MILTNVLVHHVLFWLNDKNDLPEFLKGLNSLSAISNVKYFNVGVAADTHGDKIERSYDASLLTIFDDLEAHDKYQVDPIHQDFLANYVKNFVEKVVVTDSVDA